MTPNHPHSQIGETVSPLFITDHLDTWTSAIKAKSTAGRGSGKKEELYGIKKLRELILELAVRGLLVPQDPEDEPASELLKRIAKERDSLIFKGLVKKQKAKPQVSKDETPFKLPEGWLWVRLSEVAYPQAGFAFKSKGFNEVKRGLPLVRIRDVGQTFTGTYYEGAFRDEFIINNGDYLISMDGNFRVAAWDHGEALLNQRVTRLIFFGEEHSRKFYAISLQLRLAELQGVKAYTTVDHLSGQQIADSVIASPPLAEEHRIVAKVDELMALCDQLEQRQEDNVRTHATLVETLLGALTAASERGAFAEAWQRIAAHFDTLFTTESSIDQLKQAILQLAVMGKLVEQDPGDEPAEELLKRIAAEKAKLFKEGKLKKQRAFEPVSETEMKFSIPAAWERCRLGDVSLTSDSGWSPQCELQARQSDTDWGVLKVSAVSWGEFRPEEHKLLPRGMDPRPECEVRSGDFLLSRANTEELVARGVIVEKTPPRLMMSDKIVRFVISEKTSKSFINLVNTTAASRDHYIKNASGTSSSMKNVSRATMTNLPIALPPLAEQHRIVAKVDELMALCDRLKACLQSAQTTQLHLADSLVEQAVN